MKHLSICHSSLTLPYAQGMVEKEAGVLRMLAPELKVGFSSKHPPKKDRWKLINLGN
jgi:hypothetical protein